MNSIATFFRESGTARFLIPLGIILIVFGVIMFVSDDHNKNYIEIEATVSKSTLVKEETTDAEGNVESAEYDTFVKYTVDEKEYETELGITFEHKVGEKIKIVYNPKDPSVISQPASPIINTIVLVSGVGILVGGIISAVNAVNRYKKMKEQEESWANGK